MGPYANTLLTGYNGSKIHGGLWDERRRRRRGGRIRRRRRRRRKRRREGEEV